MTTTMYLINATPLALVIWALVTGRIVPRYVRTDLEERTGWLRTRLAAFRRPAIIEDLVDLRDELKDQP